MRIALDAMGGDNAPSEIVRGALEAAQVVGSEIVLLGEPEKLGPFLPRSLPPNLNLHATTQVIEMDEKPTDALRKKRDSSLVVGVEMVKSGMADAFISAGNTGACTAASLLSWRTIPGIRRPAIASPFPNRHGGFILLDAGASPDVEPESLLDFALMGRAYAEQVMGRKDPRVHLLNIGEEETKGNIFTKAAYALLAGHPWFAGNIEGKDMFKHKCDVVVCDAFVGNVVLKTCEGVGEFMLGMIKDNVPKSGIRRLLAASLPRILAPLRKAMDYAEYGGSPLLGLNGLTIICHGRSNAKAIGNAIVLADRAAKNKLVETIRQSVCQEKEHLNG